MLDLSPSTVGLIQVTIAPLVPPLLLFLAKHPMVDNYKLSTLVDVLCGGAPVGEELMRALKRRFPHIKHVRQGRVCNFKDPSV